MAHTGYYRQMFSDSAAENYEKYFVPHIGRPLSTELLDKANLRPGERVLDVACGTGVIARSAAERVGRSGSVDALDMNPGMLEVARTAVPDDYPFRWHQSSAEAMPLPDESYDVVLCQLGLQFMEDKPAAVREMYRVLAPGGRLLVSVTGPTPQPFVIFADALGRHINPQISPFVHMVFSLHDEDEVRSLLQSAGFKDDSVQSYTRTLRLTPPNEFMWQYIHSTPLSFAVAEASEESLQALEEAVVSRWQQFVENGAMTVSPRMLIAAGRK